MLIFALLACRMSTPAPDPAGPPAPPTTPSAAPAAGPSTPGAGGSAGPDPRDAAPPEAEQDPELPYQVAVDGPCEQTVIEEIGTRLVDGDGHPVPGSGVTLIFKNGLMLVGYDTPLPVESQKPGDRVKVCLVEVPANCPPGDTRGKVYRVHDPRLGQSYTLPDAMHTCGGA